MCCLCCFDHWREQEWNISTTELLELVEVGVLEEDDIERATAVKFNPVIPELLQFSFQSIYSKNHLN